jgi:hypothetical protein
LVKFVLSEVTTSEAHLGIVLLPANLQYHAGGVEFYKLHRLKYPRVAKQQAKVKTHYETIIGSVRWQQLDDGDVLVLDIVTHPYNSWIRWRELCLSFFEL